MTDEFDYWERQFGPEQKTDPHVIGSEADYVPDFMQPFVPKEFELPEIPGMRLIVDHPWMGGRHVLVRMRNGWEVSVITHWGAYGGLEVGFYPPDSNKMGNPPFWDDVVMGYLDQRGLVEVLTKIHNLPTKERDDRQDSTTDRGSDGQPEEAAGGEGGVQRGHPDQ